MIHKSFGVQLRNERKKQGLTAVVVAKNCGVTRSYITLMESGLRLPGKKLIPIIAVALKLKTVVVLDWYLEDISQKIQSGIELL